MPWVTKGPLKFFSDSFCAFIDCPPVSILDSRLMFILMNHTFGSMTCIDPWVTAVALSNTANGGNHENRGRDSSSSHAVNIFPDGLW